MSASTGMGDVWICCGQLLLTGLAGAVWYWQRRLKLRGGLR